LPGEAGKLVERGPAIRDHSRRGRQDGPHSRAMLFGFAGTAELGMSDRNQIVNEIDRAYVRVSDPLAKTGRVESGVADVEIGPAAASSVPSGGASECARDEAPSERSPRSVEQRKQLARGPDVENAPEPVVLDDGLRCRSEVPQISEAHPVDSGRMPSAPAAPDKPGYIKQEWSVVGQKTRSQR